MHIHRSALAVVVGALALPALLAQPAIAQDRAPVAAPAKAQVTLGVGDRAPALTVAKWVKGSEVPAFKQGQVYMIEFWATWCGPCIASMPHVSELQKKYKDRGFTVIGMTSIDKHNPPNTLEAVEKMVADKGDKMGYTVAWDNERTTNEALMKASGQGGIPCSFLIDRNGMIAYIGHPMRIDDVLAQVIEDKHDIKALAAEYKRAAETERRSKEIFAKLNGAAQSKDWNTVITAADELLALDPKKFATTAGDVKFRVLFSELQDTTRAYAYARELLGGVAKDNADLLNAIAWRIVDPDTEVKDRDSALALEIAMRANEVTKGENPEILDTVACACFMKGDLKQAVEFQTKAVEHQSDAQKKKGDLEKTLAKYKEALAQKGSL